MDLEKINKLTVQYKKAVANEWSVLHIDDVQLKLKDAYTTLQERINNEPGSRAEIPQIINLVNHFVFLGEPGSGKSTLLQFIGLCFTHNNWWKVKIGAKKELIPIFINLRRFASFLSEPGPKLEQAFGLVVREYIRNLSDEEATELVWKWLYQKKLIILLDGLDEVQESIRDGVREEIRRFSSSNHGNNIKIIVSSRPAGYQNIGSSFKEFNILPLISEEIIKSFLTSWIEALQPEWSEKKSATQANRLLEQLSKNPSLQRFAYNPLILRLSAQPFVNSGEVAENRSKLYENYTAALWKRALTRGANNNLETDVFKNIERLAWQLHSNTTPEIPPEIIHLIHDKMGLINKNGDTFAFSHTTIQEYFVGKRIAKAWKENRSGAWQFLRTVLHSISWREPILLMAGELNQNDSYDLLNKIYTAHKSAGSMHEFDILIISELAREGIDLNPEIRRKILRNVRLANSKWGRFVVGGKAWRSEAVIRSLGNFGESSLPVLSEIITIKSKSQERKWDVYDERDLVAALDALEAINTPEAISLLKEIYYKAPTYYIAICSIVALGRLKETSMIPEMISLVNTGDSTMGGGGTAALLELNSTEIIPHLFNLFTTASRWDSGNTQEKIYQITNLLNEMGSAAIPFAQKGLKHEISQVRAISIRVIEKQNFIDAIPDLIKALNDRDDGVRMYAIFALVTFNAKEAIAPIYRILTTERDIALRSAAATALGHLRAKEVAKDLFRIYKIDESIQIQEDALSALRLIGAKEYLQKITLKHEIPDIFHAIKEVLSSNDYVSSHITDEFIKKLADQKQESLKFIKKQLKGDSDVKSQLTAIKILSELCVKESVKCLCDALKSKNKSVQIAALNTLSDIKSNEAITCLRELLNENDKQIKALAIEKLGDLNVQEAIPEISLQLRDKDLQDNAAIALGKMCVPESLPYLRKTQSKVPHIYIIRALHKFSQQFNHSLGKLFDVYISFNFSENKRDYGGSKNSPHFILQNLIRNTNYFKDECAKEFFIKELRKLKRAGIHKDLVDSRLEEFSNQKQFEHDPFDLEKPPWFRSFVRVFLFCTTIFLIVSISVILLLTQNVLEDILADSLDSSISSWLADNLILSLIILFFLTLILWIIDFYFKKSIKK